MKADVNIVNNMLTLSTLSQHFIIQLPFHAFVQQFHISSYVAVLSSENMAYPKFIHVTFYIPKDGEGPPEVIDIVGAVAKEESAILHVVSNLCFEFNNNVLLKNNGERVRCYIYDEKMDNLVRINSTDFLESHAQYVYVTLPEYLDKLQKYLRKKYRAMVFTPSVRSGGELGESSRSSGDKGDVKKYNSYGSTVWERVEFHKNNRENGADYSRGGKRRNQWSQGELLTAFSQFKGDEFKSWAEENTSIVKGNNTSLRCLKQT